MYFIGYLAVIPFQLILTLFFLKKKIMEEKTMIGCGLIVSILFLNLLLDFVLAIVLSKALLICSIELQNSDFVIPSALLIYCFSSYLASRIIKQY